MSQPSLHDQLKENQNPFPPPAAAVDESGLVKVEFVYEPAQTGTSEQLVLERHTTEEGQVGPTWGPHSGGQGHVNIPAVFWRHMEHVMQL